MRSLGRGGRIRRAVAARSPRLSLALPALIAILIGLLTARAGLAIAVDGSPPRDGAVEAPPDGATSSGSPSPAGPACPAGLRPEDPGAAAEAAGGKGRPPCPAPHDAALPPGGWWLPGGHPAVEAGHRRRPDDEPLSPQAPCSQRAPPSPAASPSRVS